MSEKVYENYCKLRDLKGVKDADVARGAGITKSTFSDWKNGRYTPKSDKLQKIADYFEVTVDYLMTGEETSEEETLLEKQFDKRIIAYAKELVSRDIPLERLRRYLDALEEVTKDK